MDKQIQLITSQQIVFKRGGVGDVGALVQPPQPQRTVMLLELPSKNTLLKAKTSCIQLSKLLLAYYNVGESVYLQDMQKTKQKKLHRVVGALVKNRFKRPKSGPGRAKTYISKARVCCQT